MRKRIIETQIRCNQEIEEGIYRLTLGWKAVGVTADFRGAEPGQFLNLYLQDRSMLLPRPISICLTDEEQITLVYRVTGKGTAVLSDYKAGDRIQISTPLGQGYRIDALFEALCQVPSHEKTIALVAGGLGIPPMLQLAKTIRERIGANRQIKLIAILGFQGTSFLDEDLGVFCDEIHIASENGAKGFRGNVLEMMSAEQFHADYYLSCGPKPMLKALAVLCKAMGKPLQVSLEERMGCGYGACVGCTCRTKVWAEGFLRVEQKKVCTDGPVFFGEEVIWDE